VADAVVIGAGHNGLACACYLAKAGLGVAVFEEYSAVGGMTLTEELTAPGFWSDVHASGYQLASLSPAPSELNLFDHGLELIEPEYSWAHAFPGGGCILVGADLERTRASISHYSTRDADTAVELFRRYRAERDQIVRSLFSPPERLSAAMHRMEDAPGGLDGYRFSLQSMRSWCDETFDSDEAKCLFGAFAPFVGHGPDDAAGAEISWLFASVLQADGNKLVRGGMQQVSLALAAELEALGGEIRTGARVEQIDVESGRATAVILEGGERVTVGTLVAASIDPAQHSWPCAYSARRSSARTPPSGPGESNGEMPSSSSTWPWTARSNTRPERRPASRRTSTSPRRLSMQWPGPATSVAPASFRRRRSS
jgi:phytoene dehydrogenase-like protein